MEKEKYFGTSPHLSWHSSDAPPPPPEMGGGPNSGQLQHCFLSLNWENSMDQSAQFESALSSMVSSPTSTNPHHQHPPPPPPPPADSVVIRELIGRLGSICNSGEISPQSHHYIGGNNSANTSCYSTPLNSPPKLNLSVMEHHLHHHQARGGGFPIPAPPPPPPPPFTADPGFAERAARFSCFGSRSYAGGLTGQFGLPETGKLSRVASSQSLPAGESPPKSKEMPLQDGSQLDAEFGSAREDSLASDQVINGGEMGLRGAGESNSRKRKAVPKGKAKDHTPAKDPVKMLDEDNLNSKRSRSVETSGNGKDEVKLKTEQNTSGNNGDAGQKQGKDNDSKPPEPPKQDYIHVRARRGQATDSHSLAERVRREKISERMKFLQDLVPGCNKVTGKAVMLDEIINYVQSLQRQVEFLSMKLATVNPRLDFNMESLLPKDMPPPHGSLPHPIYPLEASTPTFPYAQPPQHGTSLQSMVTNGLETQCSVNPLDTTLRRSLSMQLPSMDGFVDAASQLGAFWEDDLQSVVQMGFGQNQEVAFSSQSFHGSLPTSHMKIEL